jgi:hypothetical protein
MGVLLAMGGLAMAAAPVALGATSGAVNTFHLSGGLRGTLVLKPSLGCGDAPYLNDLTGHVTGLKGVKSWTIAINTETPGTYKATDSFRSKAHVTLSPYPLNAVQYTLTNIGGTLKVAGTGASSGSLNLTLTNLTKKLKAKLVGSWSCPPTTSS